MFHDTFDTNTIGASLISDKSYNNKCKPPLATPREKLRLHVKLIQAEEQKWN